MAQNAIHQSTKASHIYVVKSTNYVGMEYEVDTTKWTCTCTVSRTGYPSGEPCKHQHSVAQKFNLTAPNLLPYFNGEGRYLHALIALGWDRVGDKSFYGGLKEITQSTTLSASVDSNETQDDTCTMMDGETNNSADHDEGGGNLDMMLSILEEQEKLNSDVVTLGNAFIEDVQERINGTNGYSIPHWIKENFHSETVTNREPAVSATSKLSSLLHTYFSKQPSSIKAAGTRRMHVQPTAISRRREGITKGSKMAPSGRPPKRPLSELDINIQVKRGRPNNVKRKQNLRLNEAQSQANHHKHGRGH